MNYIYLNTLSQAGLLVSSSILAEFTNSSFESFKVPYPARENTTYVLQKKLPKGRI